MFVSQDHCRPFPSGGETIDAYSWFAVRTRPGREGEAQAALAGHVELGSAPRPNRAYGTGPVQPRPLRIPRSRPVPIRRGHGLVVVCPVEEVWRKVNGSARKKVKRTRPLMPGWLLLGFSERWVDWRAVLDVEAVVGVAGAERPLRIPERDIRPMLGVLVGGAIPAPDHEALMRSRAEFGVGDRCEIQAGPFEGQLVEVGAIRDGLARVMLDLMGAKVPASMPLDFLEKVA